MPSGIYKRTKKQLDNLKYWSKNRKRILNGGYHAVHKWLEKHYGKANKCESILCLGKSKRYHWAKLRDKEYEHKRENFMMFCSSCHRLYDQQAEWIEKAAITKRGIKLSEEHKRKISFAMTGKNMGIKNPNWKGGKYATS